MSYLFIYGLTFLVIIAIELIKLGSIKSKNQQLQYNQSIQTFWFLVTDIKTRINETTAITSKSKFLETVKPFLVFTPQIQLPSTEHSIHIQYKLLWTVVVLVIYLIIADIELFGINISDATETNPLNLFRPVLSLKPLTIMELGILPSITSNLLFRLLEVTNIIYIDKNDTSERALFYAIEKFVAIYVITIIQAITLITTGVYGYGIISSFLVLIQLCFGSLVVILLNEIIQSGYGIGSGISLFVAANICTDIMWKMFSPISIDTNSGLQYEGAIVELFYSRNESVITVLKESFFRHNLPNMINVFSAVVMFIIVIYFQGFRVDLPVQHKVNKYGTQNMTYPIKLFYTSYMPKIFYIAFTANIVLFGQFVSNLFGSNVITNFIGWIIYSIFPPKSIRQLLSEPMHTIIYFTFTLVISVLLCNLWMNISGTKPSDVANKLKEQKLMIKGFREKSIKVVLERYIIVAAVFGGVFISLLTFVADWMGCLSTGSGVILAVIIIFELFESYDYGKHVK